MLLAVIHDIAARKDVAFGRGGSDFGVDLFADRSDVVRRVIAGKSVGHVGGLFAGARVFKNAGSDNGHIIADQNAGGRAEKNRRVGRAVVDLAGNGRAGDLDLARSDGEHGAPGPVVAVRAGHLDVNRVDSRVGVGGHFGDIERLAVKRVEDGVGRADAFERKGVLLPVVNVGAAGKGDVARRRGDRRGRRVRRRSDVVGGVIAGQRVGDRHIMRADFRRGEPARSDDKQIVAEDDAGDGAEKDRRVGRPVVDLALRGRTGHRQLNLGDVERRTAGPVGVILAADLRVDLIRSRVGVGRKFGGIGFAVDGVEDCVPGLSPFDGQRVRRAVIDERKIVEGDVDRPFGDRGGKRLSRRSDIVGIVDRIGHADVVRADFRARERAFGGNRHIVARNDSADPAERDFGAGRPVVNLVGDFGAADRELFRIDRERRLAGPVFIIVAADLDIYVIGARVGVFGELGRPGLAVERVENGVGRLGPVEGDRVGLAVVGRFGIVERKALDFRRGDRGGDRLGNRSGIVRRVAPQQGVGDFNIVGSDIGRRERAGNRHVDMVAGNDAGDFAESDFGAGRAVIGFVGGGCAADGKLQRGDFAGDLIDFLFAGDVGADFHEEGVSADVARKGNVAPPLAVFGILRPGDRTMGGDRRLKFPIVYNGGSVSVDDLFDRAQVERAAVEAVVPDRVEFGVVVLRFPRALRLVVSPERVAVFGKQVAAVIGDEVVSERNVRKVGVAADRAVGAQVQRRIAADQNAVVEDERRPALAADRAAQVVRNRDVRRGVLSAVRGGEPLLVPRKNDVDHIQLAAVVADRAVRRRVADENRVGDIDHRVVPQVDRPAVGDVRVPREIRTGNIGAHALFDEDRAAVRFRRVVGEGRIGHRQGRADRRIDRSAVLAGVGIRDRDLVEGQIAGVVNRAAVTRAVAVFDGKAAERHVARADRKRVAHRPRVDRNHIAAVNRDRRIRGVDRQRAVGQDNRPFQPVGEGDRRGLVERLGVDDRLTKRVDVVVGIDHVVEGRHHQRADDRLVDFPFQSFGDRRKVVPRQIARDGVRHRHVPHARFGGGELARRRDRHVVVKRVDVADDDLGVGRAVVFFSDDRRAADRKLKRRDLAGYLIDFLFPFDAGADFHPERVRSGVPHGRSIAPGLAVFGVLRPGDRAVEPDRSLRLAVIDDTGSVGVGELFDRAQVKRAAVVAVVPRRVEFGVVVGGVPGAHRLVVARKRIAVGGEKITAGVGDEVVPERLGRKVRASAD